MENRPPDDADSAADLDLEAAPGPDGRRRRRSSRRGLRVPAEVAPSAGPLDLPDLTTGELLVADPTPRPDAAVAAAAPSPPPSHSSAPPRAPLDDLDLDAPTPIPLSSARASIPRVPTHPPEVEVSEGPVATVSIPVPPDGSGSSMRVVRRRIRKLGGDDGPATLAAAAPPAEPASAGPSLDAITSLSAVPEAAPDGAPPATDGSAGSRPAPPRARSSRPPPPRGERPSIFNAPTIPPEPLDGRVSPTRVQPLAPAPRPQLDTEPDHDDVEISLDDAAEVDAPRAEDDPSLALLALDVSQPIARPEPASPGVPRTSLPPPPPPDAKAPRPPPPPTPPDARALKSTVPDARRRRRMWWEELFNEDYLRAAEHLDAQQVAAEADWIEHALGVEAGASVIDIACGVGRHAVELAARRFEVTALDVSPTMCQRARDAARARGVTVEVLQSDMTSMEFDERYDAAFCVGTSFGYFDDERNAEVAQRIHRALKPHGTFLLGVANRDHVIQRQPAMSWFEGDGCVCMEETNCNYITSRLNVKRTMIFDDGRQREMEYSVRLYSLHELGQLLHQAGFRILEVSGHVRTPGAFFGPSSRDLIILAQKRGTEVVDLGAPDLGAPSEPPRS